MRASYYWSRVRLHIRAYRLREVIGYLGMDEGIEYARKRGWIDRVEGRTIYLKDPK